MISYSIVISVYNQKETLAKIMSSLAGQVKNPKMFEVVIADDGSTDGTGEFVKKARFPIFMKYLQSDGNSGRSENRNKGFAKTVGKQVIFMDGDMVPMKGLVDSHMAMWEKHPDDVIAGSIKHPDEWERDRLQEYLYSRGRLSAKEESVVPGRYFTSNNFSIPRRVFEKLSGFDTSFKGWGGEDTDFGLRLEKLGIKIRYKPGAACYHYHRRSIDEVMSEFERYGNSGYRALIEKHPDVTIFPNGWLFGLPDSKPGRFKKLIATIFSPFRSGPGISGLKTLSRIGVGGDIIFDLLFYGCLARGYSRDSR